MEKKPGAETDGIPIDQTIELLSRARAGDRRALEDLFARHTPLLRRWASGRLPRWARDIGDTVDLVQETMLATFKRLDEFEARGEGALQAYLRQALINRVRNELKRASRRPAQLAIDSGVVSDGTAPIDAAIGAETAARYEAALARLPAEMRSAVVARVELRLSYAEIAELLDKPSADAARMTVVRALMKLAEEMETGT
jgi:RNA polymerase sigma-70 factor (ECF subfamily)